MAETITTTNVLLSFLSPGDHELIDPHLEPVDLPRRYCVERPNVPLEFIYFITAGIASSVAHAGRDRRAEVGLWGRDGFSGHAVILGTDRSPFECFMQVSGHGLRISSSALREFMAVSPSLRDTLTRFVHVQYIQSAHTALSNAQALIEERLCRWILMCHDRVSGDDLPLTHDFLATMLGVRRAGVTAAIHLLEGRGLIRAERGCIIVADRDGLEVLASEIYGIPEAEYARVFGSSFREK